MGLSARGLPMRTRGGVLCALLAGIAVQVTNANEAADEPLILDKAVDVARHFGVAHATVANWRSKGMPCKPVGGNRFLYNCDEIAKWLETRERARDGNLGAPVGGVLKAARDGAPAADSNADSTQASAAAKSRQAKFDAAELRKKEADARAAELKAAKLAGEVIEREEYTENLVAVCAVFRRVMTQMEARARADHGDEAAAIVAELVAEGWAQIDEVRQRALQEERRDAS